MHVTTTDGTQRRRLPDWIRVRLPTDARFSRTNHLIQDLRLHTVCESAKCPNIFECWSRGTATFMIAGDRCTRSCGFCAVSTAKPLPLEADEPQRVAEAVRRMQLRHVVITAVARDDIEDGGSEHFFQTICAIRNACGDIVIEVLVPDFNGSRDAIARVLQARPHIFNHNIETVRRLTPTVRWRATYERSLEVLEAAKEICPEVLTKSGIMLGLGETDDEILETFRDLRAVNCEILTVGQYLQPTPRHLPVQFFVSPEQFAAWKIVAESFGFQHVASGPLVRSSYHADEVAVSR
jgi:lipoic acid synthetase